MPEPAPLASRLADAFAALDAAHPAPADRHETRAAAQRDADALPTTGPLADLVRDLVDELRTLVDLGSTSAEAEPYLRPYGVRTHEMTGSVRGMRAVCHKASEADPERAELCRDLMDKAWDGVGDAAGAWSA